jgi:RimJ/RimL family protein N-acetyltransferase
MNEYSSSITFKPLNKLSLLDVIQFSKITQNPDVMSSIGNGNLWSKQKIQDYITQEQKETLLPISRRQYWSWCIVKNATICGFIGIHKSLNQSQSKRKMKKTKTINHKKIKSKTKSYNVLASNHNNLIKLEIRIFVDTKFQGQGIATDALELLKTHIHIIFDKIKNSIELISYVKPSNVASIKIHQKTHFINNGLKHIYGSKFIYFSYLVKD